MVVTNIVLLAILALLLLSMVQREAIARRQEASLKTHTDAMEDLRLTLNTFIEEIRSVQTYGLRLQK